MNVTEMSGNLDVRNARISHQMLMHSLDFKVWESIPNQLGLCGEFSGLGSPNQPLLRQ
jgi:hypothetical protein